MENKPLFVTLPGALCDVNDTIASHAATIPLRCVFETAAGLASPTSELDQSNDPAGQRILTRSISGHGGTSPLPVTHPTKLDDTEEAPDSLNAAAGGVTLEIDDEQSFVHSVLVLEAVLHEDSEVINNFAKVIHSKGFKRNMFNTAESQLTAFHDELDKRLAGVRKRAGKRSPQGGSQSS